jgi:hypothetical protein
MPYIKRYEREKYRVIRELAKERLGSLSNEKLAGELNYIISSIIKDALGETPRYSEFNLVIGVLESAKLEIYRRMVAPYEEKKKEENGDVFQ